MKKLLLTLALCGTVSAIQPAFAQNAAPAANAAPTANAAPAANAAPDTAAYAWQLRLSAGQMWRTTTDTVTQSTQQLPAMMGGGAAVSMKTIARNHQVTEQRVVSSDEKGARIEMTYREMKQSSQMSQGDRVMFDTDNPPAGMEHLGDTARVYEGVKLSYLISPRGEVSDVKGMDELAKRLSAAMEGVAPGMMTAMRAQSASMMSPDMIAKSLSAAYKTFPLQAITPGQSWKYTDQSPMMGTTFSNQGEGTFVSRGKGLISIQQSGTFSTDAGAEFKVPMPQPDAKAPAPRSQLDLRGTSTGESQIDEKTGLELHSHSSQKMAGEIVILGIMGRGTSMTLPMTSEVEVTSQTEIIAPVA